VNNPVHARLIGSWVFVENPVDGLRLFEEGFFGRPIGEPKFRMGSQTRQPFILDLVEACYLAQKGKLVIEYGGGTLLPKEVESLARKFIDRFDEKLLAYTWLRDHGWIVQSGVKFGNDFAIYEKGPGIDHAPLVARVVKPTDRLYVADLLACGRVAASTRKAFLFVVVDARKQKVAAAVIRWRRL